MRNLHFVTAALLTVVLAGCGSGNTGGNGLSPPASPTSTNAHAKGPPIQPPRQLSSTTQLQSDVKAVQDAALERDLLNVIAKLEQDFQTVAGSQATQAQADWQQALASLQQAIADVRQLADAHSSTPDDPSPLKSGSSDGGSKPVADIINEIKDAYDLLSTVVKDLAYTIVVNNGGQANGTVKVDRRTQGPYPAIRCGAGPDNCSGAVLAGQTVEVVFEPKRGVYLIGKIESTDGACNASYNSKNGQPPGSVAYCGVTSTSGKTITITPHWVNG